jgi:bifunctional UDP-N-acetylglucosamine pyrophosphorylase/glucosamine-1-phosphate N-acetyltransferase
LNGDIPLITSQLVQNLIDTHLKERAALSFIVARDVDASIHGYGHVIQENNRIKIVEDRHMNREQLEMSDLNAGIYLFDKSFLLQYIDNLPRHEVSGEYYLTTLIEVASDSGLPICTVDAPFDQVRGVNTFKELWVAEHLKRSQLIEHFMNNGVRFSTPHSVHLDEDIRIAPGAIIGAHAQLFGKTTIGAHTEIGAFTVLQDAIIGNHTTIRAHSIIKESVIGNNCLVDSFTYVHEHAEIQDQCCIDSFNDIKNQKMARTPTYEPHDTKRNKTFVAAFKAAVDKSFAETT